MNHFSKNNKNHDTGDDSTLQLELFPEPYFTIPKACAALGLKRHAVRRAVQQGLIPAYKPFGDRIYVKLSEVEQAIATFKAGGQDNE